jgi:hypothetical protein
MSLGEFKLPVDGSNAIGYSQQFPDSLTPLRIESFNSDCNIQFRIVDDHLASISGALHLVLVQSSMVRIHVLSTNKIASIHLLSTFQEQKQLFSGQLVKIPWSQPSSQVQFTTTST